MNAVVVYFQLNVKKGQFELTDVGCELERGMKIRDVIDKNLSSNSRRLHCTAPTTSSM